MKRTKITDLEDEIERLKDRERKLLYLVYTLRINVNNHLWMLIKRRLDKIIGEGEGR
jgi:hypothetical protein